MDRHEAETVQRGIAHPGPDQPGRENEQEQARENEKSTASHIQLPDPSQDVKNDNALPQQEDGDGIAAEVVQLDNPAQCLVSRDESEKAGEELKTKQEKER